VSIGFSEEEHLSLCVQTATSDVDYQPVLQVDPIIAPVVHIVAKRVPMRWSGRAAYVISQLGSPPIVMTLAILLAAAVIAQAIAWMWASVYVVLGIALPVAQLFWLLRRGQVADLDVRRREQRSKPMMFMLAYGAVGWTVLAIGSAPLLLILIAGAALFQMATIFVITLHWKISVHCSAAAGAATVVLLVAGTPLPLLLGVPLVAWSRIRLRHHTLAQTIAGSLLGAAVFALAICLPSSWRG